MVAGTTPSATPPRMSSEAVRTRTVMDSPMSSSPPMAASGAGESWMIPDCARVSRGTTAYQMA